MTHWPNFTTQTQGEWWIKDYYIDTAFYCQCFVESPDLLINELMSQFSFSLIANIAELEKQISEMELRNHRDKEQLTSENGELKTKVDHLKHQNIELDRKINSILK